MASFNKVILVGNLTQDVELRYIASGMAVTDIRLAVNDRVKKNDQWVEETTFVDITLWGRTAEVANEYLSKGSSVLIEGRLKLDTWESNEGQKRSKLKVIGERMQMLGGRGGAPHHLFERVEDLFSIRTLVAVVGRKPRHHLCEPLWQVAPRRGDHLLHIGATPHRHPLLDRRRREQPLPDRGLRDRDPKRIEITPCIGGAVKHLGSHIGNLAHEGPCPRQAQVVAQDPRDSEIA